MYLDIRKLPYATYLYKTENVRVGKNKYKKVRELLGTLEELKKIHADPIAYYKEEFEKDRTQKLTNKKKNVLSLDFIDEEINLTDLSSLSLVDEKLEKNIGSLIIQSIYHQLGFDKLSKKISAGQRSKINLTKLLQLSIICRILYPSSKLSDFNHQDKLADVFSLTKDDIYRGLELLNKNKDELIVNLNKNIKKLIPYDLSCTHYDLTNYFVYTDDTTVLINPGYSKVKNGLPTIQMALLTDSKGLPINYKLFSGNRNDVSTLVEFLDDQKKKFNIKKTTIVADAGLVSNDNIVKILLSKNNYIFKESLLRVNKDVYSTFEKIVKPEIEKIMKANENLKGCYFSIPLDITLTVKNTKGENTKVSITQKYIFMYSKKYDERSKHIRMEELENAEKYIKEPKKLKDLFKNIASGLVKTDTKEAKAKLDEKKLDKYETTSGYSLLITNKLNTKDDEIIENYRQQYLIEESFRHLKTDLDIDNIYLKKDCRIEGHFLIGFLALSFLRIIQLLLKRKYSIEKIQENLLDFKLHKLRNNNYYQISKITNVIAEIQLALNLKINNTLYDGNDLRSLIGNIKKI
ncbi:IS1634 family transposase [Oceanivirga miroungae]|uniref:Transposase IS4-like domain-containing protein n=1 Tax=Oceanivirga miroungae TaxID=1130046 RepID=A0A6I8MAY2_9FUSO|nr:IS1634 family transposase [Oceanivirga miroungae]VWL84779.1 hypothetical protein OMES3154_00027 [Oceanivirga miroungae]VWL84993.1 hypothetical protein OMES3154_00265 [Oceanivirga miroungae]VWL85375.1 hypothetical protein OMES3154_00660 [Oceanivirga miroungae]VWL85904.1 hypothetical protein OMES3154_01190 [Oceanivirga miroungae]